MPDTLRPDQRSINMSRIRAKNTKAEVAVRRVAHRLGYRFRLHRADFPGKPDLVFPSRKSVIFVHGCFWHRHPNPSCKNSVLPKSHIEYWHPKLERNQMRDALDQAALENDGWRILIFWECELRDEQFIAAKLREFLGKPGRGPAR